ncbi:MAG: response regulator [Bacteroidetes bacterium]|nr:response regulator [Bacteroidota bacterium]MCL5738074.1 response regulator [Bacteroidota bacterium]
MANYSVLIADDDDSQREVQKLVLSDVQKSMGAELKIDEAEDSVQTRKLLGEKEYDLIILDNEFKDDLMQGHLPGIAILQLMRKSGLNMSSPTIFCSGDPYNTLRPMVEKFGAVYYPKAKADAEEMTKLYSKLLQE